MRMRNEVQQSLCDELSRTLAVHKNARNALIEASRKGPSATSATRERLRIRNAITANALTRDAYMRALCELTDFAVYGKVPERIKEQTLERRHGAGG